MAEGGGAPCGDVEEEASTMIKGREEGGVPPAQVVYAKSLPASSLHYYIDGELEDLAQELPDASAGEDLAQELWHPVDDEPSPSSSSSMKKRKRLEARHHLRTTKINLGTPPHQQHQRMPCPAALHEDEDEDDDDDHPLLVHVADQKQAEAGLGYVSLPDEAPVYRSAGSEMKASPMEDEETRRAREEQEASFVTKIAQLPYAGLTFGSVLGEGFFGKVHRGKLGEREVAIKKMVRRSFRNSSETRLFINETSVFCELDHPNILKFIGASVSPSGEHCIVTEYMAGGSLRRLLDAAPHLLTEAKKRKIARDVAVGMDYLHHHKPKIIHRDLSSNNILLDEGYSVAKVGDFGLSRFMDDGGGKMTCAVGALAWMAPEVYMGQSYSEKADVYSYAICLAELMTGCDPYLGMEPHLYASYAITNSLRPQLPDSLDEKWKEIIMACWHQDPELRPDFAEVVAYLDTYLPVDGSDGESTTTTSSTTTTTNSQNLKEPDPTPHHGDESKQPSSGPNTNIPGQQEKACPPSLSLCSSSCFSRDDEKASTGSQHNT